ARPRSAPGRPAAAAAPRHRHRHRRPGPAGPGRVREHVHAALRAGGAATNPAAAPRPGRNAPRPAPGPAVARPAPGRPGRGQPPRPARRPLPASAPPVRGSGHRQVPARTRHGTRHQPCRVLRSVRAAARRMGFMLDRVCIIGRLAGQGYTSVIMHSVAYADRVHASTRLRSPMSTARPVAILGGVRIPFCRQNTAYSDVGNLGMSVRTLGALVERFGLHGQQLGEVAMGAVIKHASDWNLGREAALSSGLSPLTPGITMQRACGTSLDTIITVANKIALGQIDSGIGGGSDTTSDVPIVYGRALRARLLAANRAKTPRDKLAAFKGFRLSELKPEFPGVAEPRTGKSMGEHCEDMAKEWNISRDSQDEWAVSSHR